MGGIVPSALRTREERYNSAIEADEALGRCAPSGLRSLMPVVGRTRAQFETWWHPYAALGLGKRTQVTSRSLQACALLPIAAQTRGRASALVRPRPVGSAATGAFARESRATP